MKRVYRCPHCRAILNPCIKLILKAQLRDHLGLFVFSPQPGNYEVAIPDDFPVRKGDMVNFFCPVCSADLTSAHDQAFAEINVTTGSHMAAVVFSKTFGRYATYFITRQDVKSYGKHASPATINFWGEGPERQ
ncbi:MAG: hypothetical protein JW841_18300 [Deltaproteobacteria bacterium]|nr:hypothetical protein [Deltaproteobacteria bacterium]